MNKLKTLLNNYKNYKKKISIYKYTLFILGYDSSTDCPKNNIERSVEVQNFYEKKIMDILLSDKYLSTIDGLYQMKDELDEVTRLDIIIEYKEKIKMLKIPKEELYKEMEVEAKSFMYWNEARLTKDYSKFIPYLNQVIEYNKKLMKWQETPSLKGYDVLLDNMEEGYNTKMYDEFFDLIEKELVPFVKEILKKEKPYNEVLDNLKFDIAKQKILTEKIANLMEYTNEVGCIRETQHPYTNWANHNDVRITTSYDESLLFSNLYSVMHEIGHALFQIHMDKKYDDTNIFNNVTCITHESQSRFYENYLGRRKSFIEFLLPLLKELFPKEFEDITLRDLYNYVNSVQAQMKRTEADELTYPLHILIRYKIEKKLFNNEITSLEINDYFNKYMFEYLGITPKDMHEGCFQDVHWATGFGYFPTYALGSSYGAMFLESLLKDVNIDECLKKGSFKEINLWLKNHIHKYSGTRKNLEVVRFVCDKDYDPMIYINYLKNKFGEIYNI